MPRKNYPQKFNTKLNVASNKRGAPGKELNMAIALGGEAIEVKRGKEYRVRRYPGGDSVYKCPGCNGDIAVGVPSYTVIQNDHIFGEQAAIDERRHWHEGCWRGYR